MTTVKTLPPCGIKYFRHYSPDLAHKVRTPEIGQFLFLNNNRMFNIGTEFKISIHLVHSILE